MRVAGGRTGGPGSLAPDATTLRTASRRLALQFTTLMVLILIGVGTLVYGIVWTSVNESRHQELAAALEVDSPRDVTSGVYVTYADRGQPRGPSSAKAGGNAGGQTSAPLPEGLPDKHALQQVSVSAEPVQSEVAAGGRSYVLLTEVRDGRLVQVAVDKHEGAEELQRLLFALAASGMLAAVGAALASNWMARRSMKPMSDALELQRRFVADASHELRTPLTLLSTRAQLLRRYVSTTSTDAAVRDGVDEVLEDSRLLTGILEDLLIAADPRESGPQAPVDLAGIADQAVHLLGDEARRRGLVLERAGAGSGAIWVIGSDVSLQRLITALVTNAFGHARRRVRVEVQGARGHAIIAVVDDGPGFPDELAARAFERFVSSRHDRPEAQQAGGRQTDSLAAGRRQPSRDGADGGEVEAPEPAERHYGLGLSLVAEIAARHGATVSIQPPTGGARIRQEQGLHGGYVEVRFPRVRAGTEGIATSD